MKIGEAFNWLTKELEIIYPSSESASVSAMVIEHLTGFSRSDQVAHRDKPLDVHALHQLTTIAQRLCKHEPVQYILGHAWFYGLKLFVDSNVLIPRPETEELVNWIINDVKALELDVFENRPNESDKTSLLKLLDVGTGSGCIALALKKQMPKAEVWGCDVSEEALNVARRNGSSLDIRVDFQGMDFLDDAQQKLLPTTDIIVSNPPYVPLKDRGIMHPNVVDHEPHQALFVPDNDALVFYRALAVFGTKRLHNGGAIYMEIHEDLGEDVVNLFTAAGYKNVELKKDMQQKNRMVKAVI